MGNLAGDRMKEPSLERCSYCVNGGLRCDLDDGTNVGFSLSPAPICGIDSR